MGPQNIKPPWTPTPNRIRPGGGVRKVGVRAGVSHSYPFFSGGGGVVWMVVTPKLPAMILIDRSLNRGIYYKDGKGCVVAPKNAILASKGEIPKAHATPAPHLIPRRLNIDGRSKRRKS